MPDGPINTLRQAARDMRSTANSLPREPWTVTENDYGEAFGNGAPWDPNTWWVMAPRVSEEEQTVALAYDSHIGEHIRAFNPRMLWAIAALLNTVAGEYDRLLGTAMHVADPLQAERMRRGPAGLEQALFVARLYLGEIPDEAEGDDD